MKHPEIIFELAAIYDDVSDSIAECNHRLGGFAEAIRSARRRSLQGRIEAFCSGCVVVARQLWRGIP